MKVPIAKVNLTKSGINSVLEPLKNGWLVQGPKVKEFEDMLSDKKINENIEKDSSSDL